MKSDNLLLWIRLGDASNYEKFDNRRNQAIEAAIDCLIENQVQCPLSVRAGGIETKGYCGDNFISLYWGDTKADRVRDLSAEQIDYIRRELERRRLNPNRLVIDLTIGVLVVTLDEGRKDGIVESDLHDGLDSRLVGFLKSLILAHAIAGVDVSSKEYAQGVEQALEKA